MDVLLLVLTMNSATTRRSQSGLWEQGGSGLQWAAVSTVSEDSREPPQNGRLPPLLWSREHYLTI